MSNNKRTKKEDERAKELLTAVGDFRSRVRLKHGREVAKPAGPSREPICNNTGARINAFLPVNAMFERTVQSPEKKK